MLFLGVFLLLYGIGAPVSITVVRGEVGDWFVFAKEVVWWIIAGLLSIFALIVGATWLTEQISILGTVCLRITVYVYSFVGIALGIYACFDIVALWHGNFAGATWHRFPVGSAGAFALLCAAVFLRSWRLENG